MSTTGDNTVKTFYVVLSYILLNFSSSIRRIITSEFEINQYIDDRFVQLIPIALSVFFFHVRF